MKTRCYDEPSEVRDRLDTLGISIQDLHDAVKIGQLSRSTCTQNDPPCLPGILAWGRTVRGLRDILIPRKWSRIDEHNLPLVVSPDGKIAIAVTTGDEGTGRAERSLGTKYPKGPATAHAVRQNAVQMRLFGFDEKVVPLIRRTSETMTWILLISRNGDEIYCELSLPSMIADDGRIEEWAERIFLPPIQIDGGGDTFRHTEENGEEIIVEITRKEH